MGSKNDKEPQNRYHVVVCGEISSGRTSIILRQTKNVFSEEDRVSIVGSSFVKQKLFVDGRTVDLSIWDYPRDSRCFNVMVKNANAAIIVYDITNESSFQTATRWIDELKQRAPDIVIAIVGNKKDLDSERVVSRDDVEKYVEGLNNDGFFQVVLHRECSAKTGEGVAKLFEDICSSNPQSNSNAP